MRYRSRTHCVMLPGVRAGTVTVLAVLLSAVSVSPAPAVTAQPIARSFDFNSDGYADLAVGVPSESLGSALAAGAVSVIYGSASGLRSASNQLWTQNSSGVKGVAGISDRFGETTASADFDGDGYADLAIGAAGDGTDARGTVSVLYGSRSGLTARDQRFSSADIGHTNVWGESLAVGDFNGDARADLAIGTPQAGADHGAVSVLHGSAAGLRTADASWVSGQAASDQVAGGVAGGAFGRSIAAGDVTGDGQDDVLVSARDMAGVNQGFHDGAYFLPGTPTGITTTGGTLLSTDTPGLVPADTRFSDLGSVLLVSDFDGDGYAEVALGDYDAGPPGSTNCQDVAACPGAVLVLPGSARGPVTRGERLWHEDVPGVPGVAEGGDVFGWSMATGDLNADSHLDLAVGAPGEVIGANNFTSGAVTVLYGSDGGLTSRGAQAWHQGSPGIKGTPESQDGFGTHVRVVDFGRGRSADLAVGTPGERVDEDLYAGAVNVLYGSSRGVTNTDQLWSQDSRGIKGSAEEYDGFGVMRG